jgi:hypothetical protein
MIGTFLRSTGHYGTARVVDGDLEAIVDVSR